MAQFLLAKKLHSTARCGISGPLVRPPTLGSPASFPQVTALPLHQTTGTAVAWRGARSARRACASRHALHRACRSVTCSLLPRVPCFPSRHLPLRAHDCAAAFRSTLLGASDPPLRSWLCAFDLLGLRECSLTGVSTRLGLGRTAGVLLLTSTRDWLSAARPGRK